MKNTIEIIEMGGSHPTFIRTPVHDVLRVYRSSTRHILVALPERTHTQIDSYVLFLKRLEIATERSDNATEIIATPISFLLQQPEASWNECLTKAKDYFTEQEFKNILAIAKELNKT